jgi:hypothetical protein
MRYRGKELRAHFNVFFFHVLDFGNVSADRYDLRVAVD